MALAGVRVIELAGLAPAPFCGMILADFGAKVIRVDRTKVSMALDTQARGKKSVAINLKTPEGVAVLKKLCVQSDVVLEPYRKGQVRGSGLKSKVFLLPWCLGSASTLVFMGQVQVNESSPLCECGSWQLCEHRPNTISMVLMTPVLCHISCSEQLIRLELHQVTRPAKHPREWKEDGCVRTTIQSNFREDWAWDSRGTLTGSVLYSALNKIAAWRPSARGTVRLKSPEIVAQF